MTWNRFPVLWLVLFASSLLWIGCSCGDDDDDDSADDDASDDDVDDDDDTDDDDDVDDDVDDDADDDVDDDVDDDSDDDIDDDADDDTTPPPTEPISVELLDVLTSDPIEGVECELIRPNGSSYDPALTTTSDSDGLCAFNQKIPVDEEFFSMKMTKTGYVDSYAWMYPSRGGWYLKLVSPTARIALAILVDATLDPTKGVVTGAVDWDSGSSFVPVGCSTVSDGAASDVFYFDDSGFPTDVRTSTNPGNGYFLAVNVPDDEATFIFETDGQSSDKTLPTIVPDAINFVNLIYFNDDFGTNPEPTPCD